MDGTTLTTEQVVTQLTDTGFERSQVVKAVEAVGPSLNDVLDYMVNYDSGTTKRKSPSASGPASIKNSRPLGKRSFSSTRPCGQMRQASISDFLQPSSKPKKCRIGNGHVEETSRASALMEGEKALLGTPPTLDQTLKSSELSYNPNLIQRVEEVDIGPGWVQKASMLLKKHFGYSSLKSFQKEALSAWLDHQDCLILAATGSGKSLCFQLPALLTGKVVVVISPLISLMHDQCLKLSKHGISACFLGSGQPDSSVEKKAMNGSYSIVYICPETVLRLIKPLQSLAEKRGIALFAIDEVHCVSKWGHDFRPDYRRLSVLRESFTASNLKCVQYDIPIMALTATATVLVRDDILKSLSMSKEAKIVLTTFFRPNLLFSVKHSRTSSPSSYANDFKELVQVYSGKKIAGGKSQCVLPDQLENALEDSSSDSSDVENREEYDINEEEINSVRKHSASALKEKQLSVEYLENDLDDFQKADDFDVSCAEFCGESPVADLKHDVPNGSLNSPSLPADKLQRMHDPVGHGPTIIYVPTRKETLRIAKYLCSNGVKAAAYNAGLPKSHLRRVHQEFQDSTLDVVVATIAFGMGIDKENVRRILHYGWPQSLEAYYQEAGRAGRDGKLAECILYANLSRTPTLLPNKRSEEQKRNAYKMLSDCFRYGMNTSNCRAKVLVEYFGEKFSHERCTSCDNCRNGPPQLQNVKDEANIFLQVIATHYNQQKFGEYSYDDYMVSDLRRFNSTEKPNLRMFVTKIREQCQKYLASDQLWWQGLARILEDKGFLREASGSFNVQVKCPEPTEQGMRFLESVQEEDLYVHPEADMLLSSTRTEKPFSSFSWGKGWADPEIRKQRLGKRNSTPRKPRKHRNRKSKRQQPELKTVRGRLTAKLAKQK